MEASNNALLNLLIQDLLNAGQENRRQATELLRLLTKTNEEHRNYLARSEVAMRALIAMVNGEQEGGTAGEAKLEENALVILFHLLMNETLREELGRKGVLKPITQNVAREERSMHGREAAVGALLCLATVDRHKGPIGIYGGIAGLISLLSSSDDSQAPAKPPSSPRARYDALKTLLHLLTFHGNKALAARSGAAPLLLGYLSPVTPALSLLALSVLQLLATHPEGAAAIASSQGVQQVAASIQRSPTLPAREKGVVVLLRVFAQQPRLAAHLELESAGLFSCLNELSIQGSRRGRRAATTLLKLCMDMEVAWKGGEPAEATSKVELGEEEVKVELPEEEEEEEEEQEDLRHGDMLHEQCSEAGGLAQMEAEAEAYDISEDDDQEADEDLYTVTSSFEVPLQLNR